MNSQSAVKDNKTRPLYQTLERLIPVKKSFVSSNVRQFLEVSEEMLHRFRASTIHATTFCSRYRLNPKREFESTSRAML